MKGEVLVALLGVAGTFALIASSRRRIPAPPDTSRCSWTIPNPIPPDVIQRARVIQALGAPLGTEYVEELGNRIYKFRREMHSPNKDIPYPHPGVGVRLCELAARAQMSIGANERKLA